MALRESDIQVLCTASLQAALLDKQTKLALSLDELHAAEAARAEQVMGRWQVRQWLPSAWELRSVACLLWAGTRTPAADANGAHCC